MKLADILNRLDSFAPWTAAASWDNVGLVVGDAERNVERILVTNEVTSAVLEEATSAQAQLVLSYHPPLLRGVTQLLPSGPAMTLYEAARRDLAIISVHTAWDAAPGGVNDVLAQAAGLDPDLCEPLCDNMGRIGVLAVPSALDEVARRVRLAMDVPFALVAKGRLSSELTRVAVAAGAGDSFVQAAAGREAQLLVTGELRHHSLLAWLATGGAAICLTHCGSERASLKVLCTALMRALGSPAPQVRLAKADVAPFAALTD